MSASGSCTPTQSVCDRFVSKDTREMRKGIQLFCKCTVFAVCVPLTLVCVGGDVFSNSLTCQLGGTGQTALGRLDK